MRKSIIRCKCGKRLEGLGSMSEVTSAAGWKKKGKYYQCPDCQGSSKKLKKGFGISDEIRPDKD